MEFLIDRSVIRIHLKTTKKNNRMDVCSGYLKMVRNSAIIIDTFFETVFFFPGAFSNHEVQSCMQRNSYRTFSSLHKCIYSLNQQNQNVVLISTNCVYAMEETDCLVKILLILSTKDNNVIDIEYDDVKNCLQEKNMIENGQEDVIAKHNDNFESMVCSVNTKCQNPEKNTMQMRHKVLKPRSKNKDELYTIKLFCNGAILTNPIFRIDVRNPYSLMQFVNSNMDPYSLCAANESFGEIVYDDEGPEPAVPHPRPSHQTNTANIALPNTTGSNDNLTQIRRLEESSNSESAPSSIPHAQEQEVNQQTFISRGPMSEIDHVNILNNEETTGGTSVPDFTAEDRIRCPQYQTDEARLSTFTKWPSDTTQTPELLAQAGFYYTGLIDAVRCFACDGGLRNWDPEDDPWTEHARWFPQCPFVQRVKGQDFVDHAQIMTEESDERNNSMAHPPDLHQLNIANLTDIGGIMRQNESLKAIVTCIKCKAQSRNILFLPCTHLCLCQDCAQQCSLCPVCDTIVHEKIKALL